MPPASRLADNVPFRRLWTARVVSRFGSALSYVVLLWITFAATGSALAVAYVGLAEFVPTVALGILSGAVVDRFDRRRVVVVSVLGRGAAMAGLVVVLELLGFRLGAVVAAAGVFSVLATYFGPGSQALLPEIVRREHLADANGLFESSEAVAGIVGMGLAGLLIVTVGPLPGLAVDAGAYLVAGLLVLAIGATASARPAATAEGLLRQVRDGLAYLRRAVGLLEVTLASLVLNFLFSLVLTFLVVYVVDVLRGTALEYGVLEGLLAAGWGLGGLAAGRSGLPRHTGRLWVAAGFVQGTIVLALVLVPVVPVALGLFFLVGVGEGILNVTLQSTVQATVPERLQGRVFATDTAISYASIPAAQLAGGLLIVVAGVPFTFVLAGVGSLAAGAALLPLREIRRVGYDPRAATPEGAAPTSGSR